MYSTAQIEALPGLGISTPPGSTWRRVLPDGRVPVQVVGEGGGAAVINWQTGRPSPRVRIGPIERLAK